MTRRVLLVLAVPALAGLALTWSAAADKPQAQTERKPAAGAEAALIDGLARRIDFPGVDDPNATLREALDQLGKQSGLTFDVNEAAFREEMIDDIFSRPIGDRPIPKMRNVTVERALRKVLTRIPATSGSTFLVRREGVEITTGAAQAAEVWPKNYNGPRLPLVNVVFDKKPLGEALKELARQSGMNVVLDGRAGDKVKLPVTARLLNTPLDTAVRLLADMADLKPYPVDNLYFVTTRENADRLAERPRWMGPVPEDIDGPPGPYRVGHGPGAHPSPNMGGM
jgi:hypothetical protein